MSDYTPYTEEEIDLLLQKYNLIFKDAKHEYEAFWNIKNVEDTLIQDTLIQQTAKSIDKEELYAYTIASDFFVNNYNDYKNFNETINKKAEELNLTLENRSYCIKNNNSLDILQKLKNTYKSRESMGISIGFNPLCDNLLLHSGGNGEEWQTKKTIIILGHDWYSLQNNNINYLPPLYQDDFTQHPYKDFYPSKDSDIFKQYNWSFLNIYPYFRLENESSTGALVGSKFYNVFYDAWGEKLKLLFSKMNLNNKIKAIITWGTHAGRSMYNTNSWKWTFQLEKKEAIPKIKIDREQNKVPIYSYYHPSVYKNDTVKNLNQYGTMMKSFKT